MSINAISSIVMGAAALVIGYGVSRIIFPKSEHPTTLQVAAADQAISTCADVSEIHKLMGKIEKSTDLSSAYSISIPLLGASYLNDNKSYAQWNEAIYKAFKIDKDASVDAMTEQLRGKATENAWILGRLLVASLRMGNHDEAHKIAAVMQNLLKDKSADLFSSWAWGYLGIYFAQENPKDYPDIKEKMLQCTEELMRQPSEKGKDNVIWALVMDLISLSHMKDDAGYQSCIQKLLDFTGTTSLPKALDTIPPGDFRAWATSIVLRAAKTKNDKTRVSELEQYLPTALASSPSDGDKMLALAVKCFE